MLLKLHWTPFCNRRPPYENYSKILGLSKIIQFIPFLPWLTRLCTFNLEQYQVKGKDRLNDGNTITLSEDSDNDVGISKRDMDL